MEDVADKAFALHPMSYGYVRSVGHSHFATDAYSEQRYFTPNDGGNLSLNLQIGEKAQRLAFRTDAEANHAELDSTESGQVHPAALAL